jgi:hypothetical protein
MQDRAGSWENYTSLFTLLINDEDGAYACHACDIHGGTAFQTVACAYACGWVSALKRSGNTTFDNNMPEPKPMRVLQAVA